MHRAPGSANQFDGLVNSIEVAVSISGHQDASLDATGFARRTPEPWRIANTSQFVHDYNALGEAQFGFLLQLGRGNRRILFQY